MLLFWTFLYTGVELCFYSGVYSAAIGFTNAFGMEAKRIVGLCGIVVGAGEGTAKIRDLSYSSLTFKLQG